MLVYYYGGLFVASFILTLIYVSQWHKRFDVNMTAIFLMIPLMNLAFLLMETSRSLDTKILALKVIYVGGCFLPWFITMCMTELCKIRVSRWIRTGTFLITSAVYCGVLTIGIAPYFYRSLVLEDVGYTMLRHKTYGPLHTVFYIIVSLYLLANLAAIIYSLVRKKQVSRRILYLLFIPVLTSITGYLAGHIQGPTGIEVTPATYVIAQFIYLCIAYRMVLYNAGDMVIESLVESGDTGFVMVDFKHRYLGSNETAKRIIPVLNDLVVDRTITNEKALEGNVLQWLNQFESQAGPEQEKQLYFPEGKNGEEIYSVQVNYLYDGRKRRGYQIFLENDTEDQKYIRLMDRYNAELEAEVARKTERIVMMHDRLILGMATMVESRDNSTGGHIRRTSEGVRLLIEEIRKGTEFGLTDSFCRKIIKAAPMHDLGKIAVDDEILRKPGRFTPEEYEKMKQHAAEGARIVHEILKETDDEEFHRIAENVAHYHHERIDGSGYPDGLKGDEIPLEARIMAIADVYDALVSKRVYKDSFSFEKANQIIMEGMGTQFDSRLAGYYEAARPKLEDYYRHEKETVRMEQNDAV